MKLLLLFSHYPPDISAGAFRAHALVDALRQLSPPGTTIDIVTTQPNRYSSHSEKAPADECLGNCHIHRVATPLHRGGLLGKLLTYVAYVYGVKRYVTGQHYDVVFASSAKLMTAVLAAHIARRKKARLYLEFRDIFVDILPDVFSARLTKVLLPIFRRLESQSIAQAARVSVVSEGFLEYYQKHFPGHHYRCFTNGIDELFLDLPGHVSASALKAGVPLRVLYAGNVGEGQGLHAIIPGLAKALLGKVRFRIIGDGGYLVTLRTALQEGSIDNVDLLPPVTREALLDEYQQADVLFLHLNDYSALRKVLPSKLFEYAATGKPIWAGVAGYAAEFIRQEVTNSAVFSPCRLEEALLAFESLSLAPCDRREFVAKYSRKQIMEAMAWDVLGLLTPSG